MHPAGFEPAMSRREADYESDAFGHLATDAYYNVTIVSLKIKCLREREFPSLRFSLRSTL
jgi:hypothetical protein